MIAHYTDHAANERTFLAWIRRPTLPSAAKRYKRTIPPYAFPDPFRYRFLTYVQLSHRSLLLQSFTYLDAQTAGNPNFHDPDPRG